MVEYDGHDDELCAKWSLQLIGSLLDGLLCLWVCTCGKPKSLRISTHGKRESKSSNGSDEEIEELHGSIGDILFKARLMGCVQKTELNGNYVSLR